MLIGSLVPMVCFTGTPQPLVRAATASQWFPKDGEICNYSLTWAMGCENGTTWINNRFDVYIKNGHQWIAPTTYAEWFSTPYTQVINNVPIIIRCTYRKISETQLNRTVAIVAGDTVFSPPNATFALVVADTGTWLTGHNLYTREDTVDINGFFNQPMIFVDYFNTALLSSETFPTPRYGFGYTTYSPAAMASTFIQAKTGSNITATWSYIGSYLQNGTYLAEASGRVLSYTFFDNMNLGSYPDYRAYRLTFTNTNPPVEDAPPFSLSLETLIVLVVSAIALLFATLALIRAIKISRSVAPPAKQKSDRK